MWRDQQRNYKLIQAVDRLLSHQVQSYLLDPDRLTPLLRSTRAALFPNNAPGASSLVAPSSPEELLALRRRCASAIWAVVPRNIGRTYFGSSLWSRSRGSSATTPEFERGLGDERSGPLNDSRNKPGPSNSRAAKKRFMADETKGAHSTKVEQSEGRIAEGDDKEEEEDRILAEIESGVLDIFSDAYCNKHLVYGMLELILVRLLPELGEKGIIELWEERLS